MQHQKLFGVAIYVTFTVTEVFEHKRHITSICIQERNECECNEYKILFLLSQWLVNDFINTDLLGDSMTA